MPEKNVDLHGSAPHKHKFALLLIDIINDFDFPEADQLLKHARPMARILLRLKRRAQKAGVPVIYINDNFGQWRSDFRRIVDYCAREGRGGDIVNLLRPEENAPTNSHKWASMCASLNLAALRHQEDNLLHLSSAFSVSCRFGTILAMQPFDRFSLGRARIDCTMPSNYS
jgi:nicotinamidase-related amidase